MLVVATGSWQAVFVSSVLLNVYASLAALFVLKPMIRAKVRAEAAPPPVAAGVG